MYRSLLVAAGTLGLAACTVEPTPQEFIDRKVPAAAVRAQTEAALRSQIVHLLEALQRGDADAARDALTPASEVVIVGPAEWHRLTGPAQVDAIVDLASAARFGEMALQDLRVDVVPRGNVGWFSAVLQFQPRDTVAVTVPLRVTGLYVEREAVWELQQAHISIPSDLLTAQPAYPSEPSPPAGDG